MVNLFMKLAYFGIPHTRGTHTIYCSLRDGLAAQGIQVFWVGTGSATQVAFDDLRWLAYLYSLTSYCLHIDTMRYVFQCK